MNANDSYFFFVPKVFGNNLLFVIDLVFFLLMTFSFLAISYIYIFNDNKFFFTRLCIKLIEYFKFLNICTGVALIIISPVIYSILFFLFEGRWWANVLTTIIYVSFIMLMFCLCFFYLLVAKKSVLAKMDNGLLRLFIKLFNLIYFINLIFILFMLDSFDVNTNLEVMYYFINFDPNLQDDISKIVMLTYLTNMTALLFISILFDNFMVVLSKNKDEKIAFSDSAKKFFLNCLVFILISSFLNYYVYVNRDLL